MIASVDTIIFLGFLVVNIVLGLTSSRGIKTIREYAIGDRNFSTATIAATIVATWITGEVFFTTISETYSNGLYFIFAAAGDVFGLLFIGFLLAPRMGEFLGKLSIAEAMGELFGSHVRIITAFFGCVGTIGIIAVQLKISGVVFEYCFNIHQYYGVIIGGIIITLYSSLGGIKSVTFTDIIQFFTFGTIIPSIAFFILGTLDNSNAILDTITKNPLFDYNQVFNFTLPKSQYFLFLFLFFGSVLGVNPAIFQRISMSKNTEQVSKSFIIAAAAYTLVILAIIWIGTILLSVKPEIEPHNLIKYILFEYSFIGLKGLTLVGIMAMVMSTADSYINTTSVLFVHDFCRPMGINIKSDELKFTRVVSVVAGILSCCLGVSSENLLNLIIITNVFYLPVVIIPFFLAVFGFRSTGKSVLISMLAGFCSLITSIILGIDILQGAALGMVVNLVFLFGSHYLLRQRGGWVGINDESSLLKTRYKRKVLVLKLLNLVRNFDYVVFFKNNNLKSEGMYCFFGLYCIISIYSTMHTIPKDTKLLYPTIISIIHTSVLFIATVLLSYPLWLENWKNTIVGSVLWNISMFYILIFIGFLLVVISNFSQLQLVAFMFNLIVIAALVKWQWALFLIIAGSSVVVQFSKNFIDINHSLINWNSIEFKIVYMLLFISSIMLMFLKPKQQHQELTEDSNLFLSSKVEDQKHELSRLHELKNEFLRNLEHEAHTPITGITSMGQVLWENYDKFSEKQRRKATQEIAKSSERLNSLVNNLIDLSKLENLNYKLNKTKVNLTDLVYERVEICQKLYIEEKDKENLNFDLKIEDKLTALCDEYYVARTIDNIVINAIQYCKKGTITITLKSTKNHTIEFSVQDDGIGIPEEDLLDIFNPFTVSSRTKTPAGGRGVGLALCKKVIDAHNGIISAKNNVSKGSLFRFILPK